MSHEEDGQVRAVHLMEQLIKTLSIKQYDLSTQEKARTLEKLSCHLTEHAGQSARTPLQPGETGLVVRGLASLAIAFITSNVTPQVQTSMRDDIRKWEKRMLELEARSNAS